MTSPTEVLDALLGATDDTKIIAALEAVRELDSPAERLEAAISAATDGADSARQRAERLRAMELSGPAVKHRDEFARSCETQARIYGQLATLMEMTPSQTVANRLATAKTMFNAARANGERHSRALRKALKRLG